MSFIKAILSYEKNWILKGLRMGKVPYGFDDINTWLDSRKSSKHNAYLQKIMRQIGCDDNESFMDSISKKGVYKEKREKIISILVNASSRQQVNSELCKILPGENVSKIIKQFQPLLKDLP